MQYKENSSVFCDEPVCCTIPARNYSRIKSGKFGYQERCVSNLEILDSLLDKAYEL